MDQGTLKYDYTVAKYFLFATLAFGFVGMLVGVILAFQMANPSLNYIFGEYLSFGRLRPVHTNVIIFGFTLSGIFASWYYMGQRILKVSMAESKFLQIVGKLHFYIYMLVMVLAAVQLLGGFSRGKEYSELFWPIALMIVVFWVLWGFSIFGLIGLRRERVMYVSVWYFIACFLAVAMLFIFNNLSVPTYFIAGIGDITHSVSMYAGSNDAMIQWWYGHNAVAFIFTVPIIAMLYYFLPKEINQPIYSYKLSIFSFWSLVFLYIWVGGHHLIYSTVPDWVQTVGSVFSLLLILPSWGSMINILLTMRGQWDHLRDSAIVKFMVFASTFYMLATLEGPIQAIKSVNALAHFTEWIIGHVHNGVLGWVGFMIMAALYHMTPRIFKREIYSKNIMEMQFWVQTLGIVLYFSSMWIAGITQGMMWRATDDYGNLLYTFMDSVNAVIPYYYIRAVGGVLYLAGFCMFIYNIYMSTKTREVSDSELAGKTPVGNGVI